MRPISVVPALALFACDISVSMTPKPSAVTPAPAPVHEHPAPVEPEPEPSSASTGGSEPAPVTSPIPGWGPDGYGPGLVEGKIPEPTPEGSFRMFDCELHTRNHDDPIVYPGKPGAAHQHMFFGAVGVDAHTTLESLQAGTTSCGGGIRNLSSYWTPTLVDANGLEVEPREVWLYYKSSALWDTPEERADIVAPPPGLRFVFGGNLPVSTRGARWLGCSTSQKQITPESCQAGETLELRISSKQCWDGVSLDSADHRSHMSFPDNAGICPASHPVKVPQITFALFWDVPASGVTGWRLSSDHAGQPPGESAHADWFNAWKPETMERFVEHCIRAGLNCNNGELGDGWRLVDAGQ